MDVEKAKSFRNFFVYLFSLVLFWGVILQTLEEKETIWNYLFNSAYGFLFLMGGIISIFQVRTFNIYGHPRKAIDFIGASFISYAIALFIWTYYNLTGESTPYPSLADVMFVLYYPLLTFSIFYFIKLFSFLIKKRVIVETFIIFIILSSISLLFENPEFGGGMGFLESFLNIFYPIGSALIFSLSYIIIRIGQGEIARNSIMISLGILLNGIADTIFNIRSYNGSYWNGDISDILAATSAFVMTYAISNIIIDLIPNKTNEAVS